MVRMRFVREPVRDGYEFYIFEHEGSVNSPKVTVGEVTMVPCGNFDPPPSGLLLQDSADMFFQELWDMGFRPKDYRDESSLVESLKDEIIYLRSIINGVFK